MPDLVEYARLSQCVYDAEVTPPEGWSLLTVYENKKTGLKIAAFEKEMNIILSVRGTANIPNYVTDLGLVLGKHPTIFDEALRVSNKMLGAHPDHKHCLTGHSLGGLIASMLALHLNREAHVFDAPGAYPFVVRRPELFANDYQRVTNYVVCGIQGRSGRVCNLVDSAFDQLGALIGITVKLSEEELLSFDSRKTSANGSGKLSVDPITFSGGSQGNASRTGLFKGTPYELVAVGLTHSMHNILAAIEGDRHLPVILEEWPSNKIVRAVHKAKDLKDMPAELTQKKLPDACQEKQPKGSCVIL